MAGGSHGRKLADGLASRETARSSISEGWRRPGAVGAESGLMAHRGASTPRTPAHEEAAAPEEAPKKQTALLHARLELDGDREAILSHLRLLMPDEGRVTVEW